jgi:hypothetical protein
VEFVAAPPEQPWGTFAIMKNLDGHQFVLSSRACDGPGTA